jgi:hypothetical protein
MLFFDVSAKPPPANPVPIPQTVNIDNSYGAQQAHLLVSVRGYPSRLVSYRTQRTVSQTAQESPYTSYMLHEHMAS